MQREPGAATLNEIRGTAEACRAALAAVESRREAFSEFLSSSGFEEVLFTGCGSSLYLGMSAAHFIQSVARIPARAVPASEVLLYPDAALPPGRSPLLAAVSRSGETSETLAAFELFRGRALGPTLGLTVEPESPLATRSGWSLVLEAAQEESVCMTKSFTAFLLAVQYLTCLYAGDASRERELLRLPDIIEGSLERWEKAAVHWASLHKPREYVFLGSGPTHGPALEGMLKMTEMALVSTRAFHSLEYRHGPKAAADSSTLIILLASGTPTELELQLAHELFGIGARVLLVCDEEPSDPDLREDTVALGTGLSDLARQAATLPFLQLLAYHLAVRLGRNPDQPRNLDRAVILEGAAF